MILLDGRHTVTPSFLSSSGTLKVVDGTTHKGKSSRKTVKAWLGLTFNWGALVGWCAVTGSIGAPAFLLYAGGIAWTLGYDTIYAHQDKEDDVLIGVKSSALKLGGATKPWLALFYGLALALFLAAGAAAGLAWPFWLAAPLLAAHFGWQIATLSLDQPLDCLAKFKANRFIGWIYLLAIFAAGLAA